MNIVHGDLIQLALAGQFDVIIHGCNCFCTMGAGIAKAIRQEFPEANASAIPASVLAWRAANGHSLPKSLTKSWPARIIPWSNISRH